MKETDVIQTVKKIIDDVCKSTHNKIFDYISDYIVYKR